MEFRPSPERVADGRALLDLLDRGGPPVDTCYWRRLRPTRGQWVFVLASGEFRRGVRPLLDLWLEHGDTFPSIGPIDVWAQGTPEPEAKGYRRALGGVSFLARAPASWAGDETLPPAVVYRLPSP